MIEYTDKNKNTYMVVVNIDSHNVPNPGDESMVPSGSRGSRAASLEMTRIGDSLKEVPVEPKSIAVIGDSIGLGIGQAMGAGGTFGVEGTHLTQSTSKMKSVRDQLNDVDPKKTPYLIIQGGTNDLGSAPEVVAKNLISIYQEALKKGFKKVTLATITPLVGELGQKADKVNEILKNMAGKENINLVDLNSALKKNDKFRVSKKDGVHPENYGVVSETLMACLNDNLIPTSLDNLTKDVTSSLNPQFEALEKENLSSALHKEYLKRAKNVDEKTAKDDLSKLQKASIEDIRFKGILLDENGKDKMASLQDETVRRLKAYTTEMSDNWYKLNYQQVKQDHELKIGLGDVLVDPSIRTVLVKKDGSNEVVLAKRGIYNGRVGFGVNGQYLATFTKDQFRIVKEDQFLSKADYEKEIKIEDDARGKDQIAYEADKKEMDSVDIDKLLTDKSYPSLDIVLNDKESVAGQIKGLSGTQRSMAMIIETEFKKAGLKPSIIAAAIINAKAESDLNPRAVGDSGHSIGLFQLNDNGGAGQGLSAAERVDPALNAQTILKREVLAGAGRNLRSAAENGASVAQLAAIFSRDIERPSDKTGQMKARAYLASKLLPTATPSVTV